MGFGKTKLDTLLNRMHSWHSSLDFYIYLFFWFCIHRQNAWLAMLVTALPMAGQGFMGKKIHRYVWFEQLILHIVFGFSFRWALGII
jgi:hypothetical protein